MARRVRILGVPLDHGAGRRGVGMGPTAIRFAQLAHRLVEAGCEIDDRGDLDVKIPETLEVGDPRARYLPLVTSVCEQLSAAVTATLDDGEFPLVIGGDHSIAIGTISGVSTHQYQKTGATTAPPKVGVLWLDAHADLNTPDSSPSGNIHGMPLACLIGRGPEVLQHIGYADVKLDPARIVQVGLRDVDDREKLRIRNQGITAYTMHEIDRRGLATVMAAAIEQVTEDVDHLHVSFDIDVLDPQIAPGTGTQVRGGFTYREAHLALEMVAETGRVGSFEMVEVNPILDTRNQTAELAVGLIASALGERIL